MSKTILYSLENISSSLKSCRDITIALDFSNTIYTSNSFHRYCVLYKGRPFYLYVILAMSDKVKGFLSLAQQVSLLKTSPFQTIEYYQSELLSFDNEREGRYYDIVLSEQYDGDTFVDLCRSSRLNIEMIVSLCSQTLWLVNSSKTVTNFAFSQIKVDSSRVLFCLVGGNGLKSIDSSDDLLLVKRLVSLIIVAYYTIVNRGRSNDCQCGVSDLEFDNIDAIFERVVADIDSKAIANCVEFVCSNGSIESCKSEIENLVTFSLDELNGIFVTRASQLDFYDISKYTLCRDLSSEFRYAIKDRKSGKFGFIDSEGRAVTEIVYDKVTAFYESIAVVTKNRYSYAINRDGVMLFSRGYPTIKWCRDQNVFVVVDKDHNYWLVSRQGEQLHAHPYAKIEEFFYNRAIIEGLDGRKGFIDPSGREIVAPICQQVLEYDGGVAYAKLSGQWYIVGYDGDMHLK